MLNIFAKILVQTIVVAAFAANGSVSLRGQHIQGGMIVGESKESIKSASIDGVKIPIHPSKTLFVYGYGRDAKAQSTLTVTFDSGATHQQQVIVEQREYDIDRVNGVAQKYVSPPESVLQRIRNDSAMIKKARNNSSFRTDFKETVIKPAQGRISGVYGSQRVFNGVPKRPHFGLDIAAPTGTSIIAPWSGKVILAEADLYYSGGTLILDHGMGITSTYIHLSKLHVEVGQEIKQGDLIAEIGATGRVTGPHLDWRINWFSRRLDPQLLLPE
ncbi:MAG: M23 family metallopeptidase [Gammaproteobacteria bacterium]|nr:M23 family metallopeptidase [Gammaproteobacteria bacterium]